MAFTDSAYPNYLVWNAPTFEWRGRATAPVGIDPPHLYLAQRLDGTSVYRLGTGCTMPYDTDVWCRLQFEAGIVRTQDGDTPPVPSATVGAMDVAIILDVTGSMDGAINSLKEQLALVAADVAAVSGNDYRLALVTSEIRVVVPFSANNLEAMRTGLDSLVAGPGYEATDEALRTAVEALPASARVGTPTLQTGDFVPFRDDARKIAVVITDTLPNGLIGDYIPGVSDVNAQEIAQEAAEGDIRVSSVYVPTGVIETFPSGIAGTERLTTILMIDYAEVSGGLYLRSRQDGSNVAALLRDVITTGGGDVPVNSPLDATSGFARPLPCCTTAACVASGGGDDTGGGPGAGDGSEDGSDGGATHDYGNEISPSGGGGYGDPNCGEIVLRNTLPDVRPSRRIGIVRVPEVGEYSRGIRGIRVDAKNDAAMREAMKNIAGLWAALDEEIDIAEKPVQFLTEAEMAELAKADVSLPYARDFYFTTPARFVSLAWVVRALDERPQEVRVSIIE
jgi:hypothetical protein